MSISGLGVLTSNQLGNQVFPPAEQQAKSAVAQSSYQSRISDFGQIQNALSSLQSQVQGSAPSVTPEAPSKPQAGYAPQEAQLFQNAPSPQSAASSEISQIANAVQSFVDAFNTSPASNQISLNPSALSGIGITAQSNGTLSLDTQALKSVLSSNPGNVAQVFSAMANQSSSAASTQAAPPPVQPQQQAQQSQQPAEQRAQYASQPSNTQPQHTNRLEAPPPPSPSSVASQYSIVSRLG